MGQLPQKNNPARPTELTRLIAKLGHPGQTRPSVTGLLTPLVNVKHPSNLTRLLAKIAQSGPIFGGCNRNSKLVIQLKSKYINYYCKNSIKGTYNFVNNVHPDRSENTDPLYRRSNHDV